MSRPIFEPTWSNPRYLFLKNGYRTLGHCAPSCKRIIFLTRLEAFAYRQRVPRKYTKRSDSSKDGGNSAEVTSAAPQVMEPNTPENSAVTTTLDTPPPFTPKASQDAAAERVTFKITNGKIDFESIRASNADRSKEIIKASIADPALLTWAGVSASASAAAVPGGTIVTPEDAKYILDFEASLLTTVCGLKYKLPISEVKKIMGWSDREHEILDARVAGVMTKYLPEDFKQSMDWILCLGSFGSMTMIKFAMLGNLVAQQKQAPKPADTPLPPAAAPEEKKPEAKTDADMFAVGAGTGAVQ